MLPAERRRKLAKIIQETGAVNTRVLAENLGTSVMTVRRDLKILEKQGRLEIIWGGAVSVHFLAHDIPYARKMERMLEAKRAIARAALELVEDDSFIILDAGTTTLELAKLLVGRRLTVVTPDLQIALLLSSSPETRVHVAGGQVDPVSRACNDGITVDFLHSFQPSLSFVGTNVWDVERGVSTSSGMKMHVKRRMMLSALQSVLLADSSKYANYSPWRVAGVEDFSLLISDSGLPAAARDELAEAGATLHIADKP